MGAYLTMATPTHGSSHWIEGPQSFICRRSWNTQVDVQEITMLQLPENEHVFEPQSHGGVVQIMIVLEKSEGIVR